MRQQRILVFLFIGLVTAVIALSLNLLDTQKEVARIQEQKAGLEIDRETDRQKALQHISSLQEEVARRQRLEQEQREAVAECQTQRDGKSRQLEEAMQELNEARSALRELEAREAEVSQTLAGCEAVRDECLQKEQAEGGRLEGSAKMIQELEWQNERLVAMNKELKDRIQQVASDGEQQHWKSEIARAQTQAQGGSGTGVIAYLARKDQLENLWLSMELLEANFLYCHPYPVVIFAGEDLTDAEVLSIREKVPSATSVTFEPICIENCVFGSLMSVDEVNGEIIANQLKMTIGDLNKERFLAGEIFRHPSLTSYELLWLMEPTTYILYDITDDPFAGVASNDCKHGFSQVEDIQDTSGLAGPLFIFNAFILALEHDFTEWVPKDLTDSVKNSLTNPITGEYLYRSYSTRLEIIRLGMWRSSKWLTVYDFLDQSKIFFQHDWRAGFIRAMALSLLAEEKEVCQISQETITYSFNEYPQESLIDEAMKQPLDRCSQFFEKDLEEDETEDEPDGWDNQNERQETAEGEGPGVAEAGEKGEGVEAVKPDEKVEGEAALLPEKY